MSNAKNKEHNLASEDPIKAKNGHIIKKSDDSQSNNPYNEPIGFKKIQLTTTIICCFVTLIIGFFIGKNWYKIEADVNFSRINKGEIDFSSLNDVYSLLAENYDGDLNTSSGDFLSPYVSLYFYIQDNAVAIQHIYKLMEKAVKESPKNK